MSEREAGWYHVRTGVGWECARWENGRWFIVGTGFSYGDGDFDEIGPRIPDPDEPWQCVPVEIGENLSLRHALFPLGDPQAQEEHWRDVLDAAPKP